MHFFGEDYNVHHRFLFKTRIYRSLFYEQVQLYRADESCSHRRELELHLNYFILHSHNRKDGITIITNFLFWHFRILLISAGPTFEYELKDCAVPPTAKTAHSLRFSFSVWKHKEWHFRTRDLADIPVTALRIAARKHSNSVDIEKATYVSEVSKALPQERHC